MIKRNIKSLFFLNYTEKTLSLINTQKQALIKIFASQSIQQRINTFQRFHANDGMMVENKTEFKYEIENPSYLKFWNAKSLSEFIKQSRTPPCVRILHAVSHIQYNAFSSYCHTYFTLSKEITNQHYRNQFEQEIKKIALDQGRHFLMLKQRLQQLGVKYGDIPVIDHLNRAIEQTKDSLHERITRISIIHQGKGMKAVKSLINQLNKQNDQKSIQILKIIQKQQVYHYENGLKWFAYLCHQQNKPILQVLNSLKSHQRYRMLDVDLISEQIQSKKFVFN